MSKPNKYSPRVNMPENVVAAYWNGSISRKEAQDIFTQYGDAITKQAMMITRLDMCIAYLCEKFSVTPEDVQKWAEEKAKLAEAENGNVSTFSA